MSSKANSTTLFLCFNILFFLLVSNPAKCQAPEPDSSSVPDPNPDTQPTPDPVPNSAPNTSSPAAPAPPSRRCPVNPITSVAVCVASLLTTGPLSLASKNAPCCKVLSILDRRESSVCLCPLLRVFVREIKLDITAVNAVLGLCGVQGPINIVCTN